MSKGNHKKGFERGKELRRRAKNGRTNFRSVGHKPPPDPGDDPAQIHYHWPAYLEHLTVRAYSPNTIRRRKQTLRRFLWWAIERSLGEVQEITIAHLESYQSWLWRYRKPNGKPMAVNTQRGELHIVQDYFRWMVKKRILVANPASELELPRAQNQLPPEALTVRQIEALMSVPDISDLLGIRDRAILETLYATAMRRGELCGLHIEDLNLDRLTLHIRKAKGNKERIVPVGTCALIWINRYLEQVRPRLLIETQQRGLFLTSLGEPFPPKGLGQHVSKLLRAADIAKGGPHLLRHTCATHLLENEADSRYIQQLLGHSKADTTALYAQVSITQLQAVHARCHPAEKRV
ncbi:MAG: integrase/recombinase XerD [Paracoccaceae bacterium]|jgi:integrase/recombinase XerD